MKKLIVLLSIVVTNCIGQSFIPTISPINQAIQPGQNTSFSISYTTTGGYNASIFLQLILPSCLAPNVNLSANSLNSPYPTATINVTNTTNVPPGIHHIVLKSFNGALIKYDTCLLTVNSLSTPSWFTYDKANFPLYDQIVEKSLYVKNKIWFFTSCCNYGNPGGRSIMSFDGKNWEGWYGGNQHFKTDVCGDTILKNTVPSLSAAFNLRDVTKYGTDVYYITMTEIIKIDTNVVFSFIPTPSDLNTWSNHLAKIRFDNFGKIWLKSTDFIYYQDVNNLWQKLSLVGAPFIISDVKDFTFDSNNHIWFATTNNGISTYNGTFWQNYKSTNSNLPTDMFSFISKDKFDSIYVATTSAIYKFNGSATWTSTTFTSGTAFGLNNGALEFDNSNRAHIAMNNLYSRQTSTGFITYNSSNSPLFTNGFPISIDFDLNNNIVFGDANGGLIKYGIWNFVTTGTNQIKKENIDFDIFPNPASGNFQIKLNDNKSYKIEVLNCLSKSILNIDEAHGNMISISTENFSAGIYFVKISDHIGNSSVKKLVKQ
jgi:hypothetical protein